ALAHGAPRVPRAPSRRLVSSVVVFGSRGDAFAVLAVDCPPELPQTGSATATKVRRFVHRTRLLATKPEPERPSTKVPPMRILVTGGAGFIGSNFVRFWLDRHPDDHLVVLDLLTYAGNRTTLDDVEERFVFVEGDIGDRELGERVLRDEEIDTIVNFAAESHNSLAVVDPVRFFRTNALGTQTLLEAARTTGGIRRFHHISTCEVYGDLPLDTDEVFTEESPYRPRTPYNASKASADHAVRAYSETYGLPVTITNCSNNYGPYQFPEKVIPLFVTNALDEQPLPLYTSTQNRREWLHALDHCRAIELVLERGAEGETYNVGSGV